MAIAMLAWMIAIPALGFMTGLRSMTPMAIFCFFAWRHLMPLGHTWAFWTERPVTVIVFALFAVGELIVDKLPQCPNRTGVFPLIVRIGFGGLLGALAATALHGSLIEGVLLGALGALAGTFVGFHLRASLPKRLGISDLPVALVEDAIAIGVSILALGIISG